MSGCFFWNTVYMTNVYVLTQVLIRLSFSAVVFLPTSYQPRVSLSQSPSVSCLAHLTKCFRNINRLGWETLTSRRSAEWKLTTPLLVRSCLCATDLRANETITVKFHYLQIYRPHWTNIRPVIITRNMATAMHCILRLSVMPVILGFNHETVLVDNIVPNFTTIGQCAAESLSYQIFPSRCQFCKGGGALPNRHMLAQRGMDWTALKLDRRLTRSFYISDILLRLKTKAAQRRVGWKIEAKFRTLLTACKN